MTKHKEAAADALAKGILLFRAGKQKLEQCYLELGDTPQTQGTRDTRRRIRIMIEQMDNATKGILRSIRKTDIVDTLDDQALDIAEIVEAIETGNCTYLR